MHPSRSALDLQSVLHWAAACLLLLLTAAAAAQTPRPGSDDAEELRAVITAWASAWQSQFVDEYLAHYLPEFMTEGFASHDDWQAERRQRITEPEYIRIALDEFEIVRFSANTATLRFRLRYSRPGYADSTRKELQLQRSTQGWQIASERNLEVSRLPAP